ncbi:MAG: hypothetical protein AAF485_12295, partial [Chloroflexota bacterium]
YHIEVINIFNLHKNKVEALYTSTASTQYSNNDPELLTRGPYNNIYTDEDIAKLVQTVTNQVYQTIEKKAKES